MALARGLVARGVRPTLLAPGGLAGSNDATLCAFLDEVAATAPPGFVADVFPRTLVHTGRGAVDLQRPYARLAPRALARAVGDGVAVVDDRVVAVADDGRAVTTASGRTLAASFVVDATGHRPVLVRQTSTASSRLPAPASPSAQSAAQQSAQQAAFGIFVDGVDDELTPGTALFMDWRAPFGPDDVDDGGPPSFLYALAFGDGRLLLEETSLAAAPAVPFDVLEKRLRARLRRRGTRIRREIGVERVLFPLQGALPLPAQPVGAFGASLGLVQPVTGYTVARSLRAVDVVADVVVAGIRVGTAPRSIADDVLSRVWTPEARARRRLQLFGLDALCAFDGDSARAFFGAFFEQPAPVWRGFLDGTSSSIELRRSMWRVFAAVPSSVRLHLMRGAFSPLASAVVGDVVKDVVAHGARPADAPAFGATP